MAVPVIPRSEWTDHPRFAEHTALLESHDSFRGRSVWIIDRLRDLAPRGSSDARRRTRWVKRMRVDFRWWRASMGAHERYEERKLYPYLTHRFGLSFEPLTRDHRALYVQADRVERAFAEAHADDGRARSLLSLLPLSQLIHELETHRTLLHRHLEREEDIVIPLLLSLSRDEYDRFRQTSLEQLLTTHPYTS